MALLSSCVAGEVAFRLLFSPLGSKVIARSACIVGGLAFPAYFSFKAIELKDSPEQEHWLFYWTVYGCFSSVEVFLDKLLSWLPGYYHAKLAFLVWLQLPCKNGSHQILRSYIRPLLLKYQSVLDAVVNSTCNDINSFVVAYLHELKFLKAVTHKVSQYVTGDVSGTLTHPDGTISKPKLSKNQQKIGHSMASSPECDCKVRKF